MRFNKASVLFLANLHPPQYSNSTCGPHGTHVAGIIGANSTLPDPVFTGVAPQATLHMYRVL